MNENLKPYKKGELSRELAVEYGRKGGLKKSENEKKRKKLKDLAVMIGELGINDESVKTRMAEMGIDEEDMTNDASIIVALYDKAKNGDVQAFNAIRDIKGEKPKDEVEQKVDSNVTINYLSASNKFASREGEVED
jgi:hypothetical protein